MVTESPRSGIIFAVVGPVVEFPFTVSRPVGVVNAPVDPVVSPKNTFKPGTEVAKAGRVSDVDVSATESVDPLFELKVTTSRPAVVESANAFVAVPAVTASVGAVKNVACEGTELSTPIPNAATATSALRLLLLPR